MALIVCRECKTQISSTAASCPKCGAVPKRTSAFTWIIAVIAGLWLIGYIGTLTQKPLPTLAAASAASSSPTARAPTPKEAAIAAAQVNFTWKRTAFNTILELNATIVNGSKYNFKDFRVECDGIAKSGTKIDSNSKVVYDAVRGGESLHISELNMGFLNSQVDSVRCGIADLVI